jgi:hypothetical protein
MWTRDLSNTKQEYQPIDDQDLHSEIDKNSEVKWLLYIPPALTYCGVQTCC